MPREDRAILAGMVLRISELTCLKKSCLDLDSGLIGPQARKVVTVPTRTVTPKTAMLRMRCDGVTVVTVLTSANSTRERKIGNWIREGGA